MDKNRKMDAKKRLTLFVSKPLSASDIKLCYLLFLHFCDALFLAGDTRIFTPLCPLFLFRGQYYLRCVIFKREPFRHIKLPDVIEVNI